MAACPQCGSRSIRLVINPLTWLAHLVTERRASKCPRCGWRGWKHKKEWLHIPAAGILRGGTGHDVSFQHRLDRSVVSPEPGEGHQTHGPPISDEAFETVVQDGVSAPDLGAIDENLAAAKSKGSLPRTSPGGPGVVDDNLAGRASKRPTGSADGGRPGRRRNL